METSFNVIPLNTYDIHGTLSKPSQGDTQGGECTGNNQIPHHSLGHQQ
jgi:hypothetical protein